jgi:Leucine-rich repeat (LRR) protein
MLIIKLSENFNSPGHRQSPTADTKMNDEAPPSLDVPPPPRRNVLSFKMIFERNMTSGPRGSTDTCADDLYNLARVHLDHMQITHIDNLDCLGAITHLYLHDNRIAALDNIECLGSLKYLSLARNRITELPDMAWMHALRLLDLADNAIAHVHTLHMPQQLSILFLQGNPCCLVDNYRYARIE